MTGYASETSCSAPAWSFAAQHAAARSNCAHAVASSQPLACARASARRSHGSASDSRPVSTQNRPYPGAGDDPKVVGGLAAPAVVVYLTNDALPQRD